MNIRLNKLQLAFTFFLSLPVASYGSTPIINSVSGTVGHGQLLTIIGSSLMDENKNNWDKAFTSGSTYGFEGSSPSVDGYTVYNASYSSAVSLAGSKSIKFSITGQHTATINHNPRSSGLIYPSIKGDWYVRGYVRWDTNEWPSEYMKMMWAPNTSGGAYVLEPAGRTKMRGSGDAYTKVSYWNIPSKSGGQIQSNRWYCLEMRGSTTSNIYEVWMDGQLLTSETPSSKLSGQWFEFGIINLDGTSSSFLMDQYWDNFVISSSRIYPSTIVEIGNNSNYASATIAYQAPVSLSDSSITVKADLSTLGTGPYYLWVTNNRQERSQAYFLGTGGGTVLLPPSSLTVLP